MNTRRKDPGIIVCTTRTLQKSLKDYLDGKKSVIGAYRFAKQIVCGWQIAGQLKVRPMPIRKSHSGKNLWENHCV